MFTRINIFDEVIHLFALFKANKRHGNFKKAQEFFCEENLKSTVTPQYNAPRYNADRL